MVEPPQYTLSSYYAQREGLLKRIQFGLQTDLRFGAAWLEGSYGRGEQDAVSDLDLCVVVTDELCSSLLVRSAMTAGTSPISRLNVFQKFGEPVNIHENHYNAPHGGSFSAVLYRYPPVIVDWVLVPQVLARRPAQTKLLFDRVSVPRVRDGDYVHPKDESTESSDLSRQANPEQVLAERVAFYWMMAAVTAKYIVRRQGNIADNLLQSVINTADDIGRLLGKQFLRLPCARSSKPQELAGCLLKLCDEVEAYGIPSQPRFCIEAVLNLL